MKVITTDDVLDYFEKHQPKALPTTKEIYTPNYSIYGVLPWWKVSQAVCLLAGIATMDSETYYTLKSFDWLHEKIRISLKAGSQGHNASHYQSFSYYVAFEFPIKARTITFLKNLSGLLNEAIKKGEIVCRRVKTDTSFDDLLVPNDVIAWAEKKTISIPNELSKAMLQRKTINTLALPEIFPDEICFNAAYNSVRIERNRLKPRFLPSAKEGILNYSPVNYSKEEKNNISNNQKSKKSSGNVLCEPVPSEIYSKLSKEELNLPLVNLLYHIGNEVRSRLLDKEGIRQLLKMLQEKAPCAPAAFKRTTWSLDEAVLIYHNIDPSIFDEFIHSSSSFVLCRYIVLLLDKEERIFENFQNYLHAKTNGHIPQQVCLSVFVQFLTEKKYTIPKHFSILLNNSCNPNSAKSNNAQSISSPAQKLLSNLIDQRRLIIELCLNELFKNPDERASHLGLIDQIGVVNDGFSDIKTERVPPTIYQEHRYRAIGALLRHFDPNIPISEIKKHFLIEKFKLSGKKIPTIKTFGVWMNREKIYNRSPKK